MKSILNKSQQALVKRIAASSGQPLATTINEVLAECGCGVIVEIKKERAYLLGDDNRCIDKIVQILSVVELLVAQGYLFPVLTGGSNVIIAGFSNDTNAAEITDGYEISEGKVSIFDNTATIKAHEEILHTYKCILCPQSLYMPLSNCMQSEYYATESLRNLIKNGFVSQSTRQYIKQLCIARGAFIVALIAFIASLTVVPRCTVQYQNEYGVTTIAPSQIDTIVHSLNHILED